MVKLLPHSKCYTVTFPLITNQIAFIVKVCSPTAPITWWIVEWAVCREYRAIWDTGAMKTSINLKLAQELWLQPIRPIATSGTWWTHHGFEYMVDLHFMDASKKTALLFQNIIISGIPFDDWIQMLIWMDIIAAWDTTITNNKWITTLSYVQPSQIVVDYVKSYNEQYMTTTHTKSPKSDIREIRKKEKAKKKKWKWK